MRERIGGWSFKIHGSPQNFIEFHDSYSLFFLSNYFYLAVSTFDNTGSEIALSWSPMGLKIFCIGNHILNSLLVASGQ